MKNLITLLLVFLCLNAVSKDKSFVKKYTVQVVMSGANFPVDSLNVPDISASPVVKHMEREKAALKKDKMYNPDIKDLVIAEPLSHNKWEYDHYSKLGLDLNGAGADVDLRLEKLEREDLYKAVSAIIILSFLVILWRKYKKRQFDPELIKQLSRYKMIIKNTAIVVLVIFIVICCLQVAFGVLSSIENALTQIPVWIEVAVFIGGLIIYFNLIPKAKE